MAEKAAGETTATDGDPGPSILEELLALVPRLADRTSAQVQFSQSLLSMFPCTKSLFSESPQEPEDLPEHEAAQPTDVLTVLADDEAGVEGDPDAAAPAGVAESEEETPTAPPVEDLAIPGYDSLAASQVVPRLTTLSTGELEAVGAYETANRQRRTILNRVTALLAD